MFRKGWASKYYFFEIAFALLGFVLSLYLTIQHTRLQSGIQDSASFCSLGSLWDCDRINANPFSSIGGVPLASWGSVLYACLFILSLVARPKTKAFPTLQRIGAELSCLGLLFDLFLLYVQISAIRSLCILCLMTYGATFGYFYCATRLLYPETPFLRAGFYSVWISKDYLKLWSVRKKLLVVALLTLASGFAIYHLPAVVRSESQSDTENRKRMVEQFFQNWQKMPAKKIQALSTDGVLGNSAARVQMVLFSDFECPHCRRAAFAFHTLSKTRIESFHLIFKHYPLDSSCNAALSHPLHPHSCRLARLAVCAQEKGRFWEFHDNVFFHSVDILKSSQAFEDSLKGLFTTEEIAHCVNSEKSCNAVVENIHEGNELSITGTPALFVNGREIKIPITIENMDRLIEVAGGRNSQ